MRTNIFIKNMNEKIAEASTPLHREKPVVLVVQMVRVLAQAARGGVQAPPSAILFLVLWVVYKRIFIIFNI